MSLDRILNLEVILETYFSEPVQLGKIVAFFFCFPDSLSFLPQQHPSHLWNTCRNAKQGWRQCPVFEAFLQLRKKQKDVGFSTWPGEGPTAKTPPSVRFLFLSTICYQPFFHFPALILLPHYQYFHLPYFYKASGSFFGRNLTVIQITQLIFEQNLLLKSVGNSC